ncbi:hypothetical protein [Tenacibaculum piscium]|uniref:hypothetical protein n=1 Tax=Tenacibaculum piscium TaxID=1458515 RepID=UPI0023BA2460|nr:hypothetical protein [Tenacibaculum piscium]
MTGSTASSRRYGSQEITMVTTSTRSDWKVRRAEGSNSVKWYALGNTYQGYTPIIDFSGNTGSETVVIKSSRGLTDLSCFNNNQITELDVTQDVRLTYLNCHNNQLTVLDVSKNVSLTNLYCHRNQLTVLDVSKNVSLTTLYCHANPTLTTIYVNQNQLANIPTSWYKDAHTQYVLKQ